MPISLIATVYNEGENIHGLMQSILAQSRLPDEVVIVDGGSTDDTVEILRSYAGRLPLRVIVGGRCNISQGRNRAIAAAQGDIIAITDAGVRLADDWLENITQPLLDHPQVTVVAGFFKADPTTLFETAMGAAVLPLVNEINPASFLPSSRSVAARKLSASAVNGYPEWLDYCEDLIFDLRLKAVNPPFVFVPDALVYFRPRSSLRAYFRQYYLYARGDGKADLWRRRHAIRYCVYLIIVPGVFLPGFLGHPLLWLLYPVGGGIYLYRPYRRVPVVMQSAPDRSMRAWLYVLLMIPIIRLVGDIAKMIGYPVGWRWRLGNRPPNWKLDCEELSSDS